MSEGDIVRGIRRFAKIFKDAADGNLNEADTVQRVTRFFEEVLGYDPFREITREHAIKGTYVDVAIRIDEETRVLVEVKSAGISLRESHTQQAQNYAANRGIPWVLLTNGCRYILYRVEVEGAIEAAEVFDVDIVTSPLETIIQRLGLLHRKALKKGIELEKFYRLQRTLSPEMILKALSTETVLTVICRELRNITGTRADEETVFEALKTLVKDSALLSDLKIRRKPRPVRMAGELTPVPAPNGKDE